ncbi:hypothetical protein CH063_00879, partial [Colletotrichum higginsianum]
PPNKFRLRAVLSHPNEPSSAGVVSTCQRQVLSSPFFRSLYFSNVVGQDRERGRSILDLRKRIPFIHPYSSHPEEFAFKYFPFRTLQSWFPLPRKSCRARLKRKRQSASDPSLDRLGGLFESPALRYPAKQPHARLDANRYRLRSNKIFYLSLPNNSKKNKGRKEEEEKPENLSLFPLCMR